MREKGRRLSQLFEDYGWEHVADCNYFSIFRQSKQDVDVSIYSDSESQYEMVKRIFKSRYLTAFFLYVISSTLLLRSHPSFFLGISVVYLPILTYCAYRFYVLRNKYRK
ncbi:DUF2812 domain-containing protein [Streptococcus saliviloxodontae]|uniref:DUF2812 domain-containing protein n=1 Tax=Streptococcus saliviloxodontae TaxID=1349416 RepID=A0ABS2PKH7_9STRE|nr:hypothetical protein [Streptococcus saliviloxodontae]